MERRARHCLPIALAAIALAACSPRPPETPAPEPEQASEDQDTSPPYYHGPPQPCPHPPETPTVLSTPILMDVRFEVRGVTVPHRLPTEQQVSTPVPLYIEPPAELHIRAATVHYKPFGSSNYWKLEMQRLEAAVSLKWGFAVGTGFAAEISCREVAATGNVKLYITLDDGSGHAIESLGSQKEPLHIDIKNEIGGDPPSLPGKGAPGRCKEDCLYPNEMD